MSRKQDTDFFGGMITGRAKSDEALLRGDSGKTFDWNKAAHIIAERKPKTAYAGLAEDWNNTSGVIFDEGGIVPRDETYTYLASMWATPILDVDGEEIDCFVPSDETEWDSRTYWPDSARTVLEVA